MSIQNLSIYCRFISPTAQWLSFLKYLIVKSNLTCPNRIPPCHPETFFYTFSHLYHGHLALPIASTKRLEVNIDSSPTPLLFLTLHLIHQHILSVLYLKYIKNKATFSLRLLVSSLSVLTYYCSSFQTGFPVFVPVYYG